MNVCKEIINLEVVSKHLNKLNDMFDVTHDQEDMSVRLAEIIKAKSAEYHQCETRIENLTKKLQGDRSSRMQSKQKENASILALVQFFQDEEERVNMVKIAEMQKQLVADEATRLEGMDEWKARILGISKENVI
jgi:Skp family chaperone for outer membrane proteins